MWFLIGIVLPMISPARAAEQGRAADWAQALAILRAAPADLDLRPELYDGPLKTEAVEKILKEPVSAEATLSAWEQRVSGARKSAELLGLGADLLGIHASAAEKHAAIACPGWPESLNKAIAPILAPLAYAQRKTLNAASSMTEPDRQAALDLIMGPILNEDFKRTPDFAYARLSSFDLPSMLGAARELADSIDDALPRLMKLDGSGLEHDRRCPLPGGDLVVLSEGEKEVSAQDLESASLVINISGRKHYRAPVAAAGAGQVRVLIDLGIPEFDAQGGSTLGSGVFGVGLAYLPRLSSGTRIAAGDFSLGAGLFGVGGAFIDGDSLQISTTRFGEGAGAFGVGILSIAGDGARLEARFSSQGFGFTRGAGLLKVKGGGAALRGGLYYADPHEPVAFNSFCQGAGLGPRAFAGGGVGLAYVEGVSASLESGYFSQGAGYWHGMGALFLRGDGGRLKARRYSQGAGIHSAAGALIVDGSFNKTATWGVGPGFGWDDGAGFFFARGSENLFQADWATGRAEFNSDALVRVVGDRNLLSLPGLGTGTFRRFGPSSAVALILGQDNRLVIPGLSTATAAGTEFMPSPWGVVLSAGALRLVPRIETEKPDWPAADRGAETQREHALLLTALENRSVKGALFAAAAAGFDMKALQAGARSLLGLEPSSAPELVAAADPDRFDEALWLRLAAAGIGTAAAEAAARAPAHGRREALLLDLMRFGSARAGAPAAVAALRDRDARVRRSGAALLGSLLGDQTGDEPGRLRQLQASIDWLASGGRSTATLAAGIGQVRLPELFSYLSLGMTVPGAERWGLLNVAGNPFDAVSNETVAAYGMILAQNPDVWRTAAAAELAASREQKGESAEALLKTARDDDPSVRAAALTALGQIGEKADAIARGLDDKSAVVREAAASALGRLGPAGLPSLEKALGSSQWRVRATAAAGFAQCPDPGALAPLRKAFKDEDERVRLAAIAAPAAFQNALAPRKTELLPALKELLRKDASASVRAAAAAMIAAIAPAP